ncbi:MAG: hypothetical protein ABEJ22_02895 [Haloferacaceae archaeon]
MSTERPPRRFPTGTGLLVGYALGVVVGIVAWLISGRVVVGLILFVATGTALGVAFEQSRTSRPLTRRERRTAWLLLVAGVLVAVFLWVFAGFADGTAVLAVR